MLSNIFKVLTSNAIIALIGILTNVMFPIWMTIEDYAYYQRYILYTSYINICHLGIASGMFLNYAGKKYHSIDKQQYKSEIYLIFIALLFFSVLGFAFFCFQQDVLVLAVVLSVLPQCLIASFLALYQAWERFTSYSIINAMPKLLLAVAGIAVYVFTHDLSGQLVIWAFVVIQWAIAIYFVREFYDFTKDVPSAKIFSLSNLKTTYDGFLITLGNYVNLLFHSIDKQFVTLFYAVNSFAMYSFAMSLQVIMMIFITAIANPFYPRLAKDDVTPDFLNSIKRILFVFGAYSGCAYFAVAVFVKHYVSKYVNSLEVAAIFFAVFPAMAVINVLYINLYKIRRMLAKYICTLVGFLLGACALNFSAIWLGAGYLGIAWAALLLYYIWLFYSQIDFADITIDKCDCLFLAGFFLLYRFSMLISSEILGFLSYGVIITIWSLLIYKTTIIEYKAMILKRIFKK